MNLFKVICLLCINTSTAYAQLNDSISVAPSIKGYPCNDTLQKEKTSSFHFIKPLIIPTAFATYGFIALGNNGLKKMDDNIQQCIQRKYPTFSTHLDDYIEFAPLVTVYGLNAVGIHGKNNFRDRSTIIGMSALMLTAANVTIDHLIKKERPDGSDFRSFPSSHTAAAFATAEFLHQEYKDVSILYSIAGYTAAIATGALRVYNNKHWFSDVVIGAGMGILATKASYWIYPILQKGIFKNKSAYNTIAIPYYNGNSGGILLTHTL